MAWNNLADNQIPSFADLQSSPFTLKPEQSNPGTNQCVNRAEALTLYNLDSTYMAGYTNNRLVPKDTFVAVEVTYTFYGTYYPQNPCDPQIAVYYSSNGLWYYESGGDYYDVSFGNIYSSYDPGQDIYIYSMYNFAPNNPTPVYYGQATSPCAPF